MDVDNKKDRTVIIYHLLNFGNLKQIQWLFKNVKKADIKKVLKNPWRGSWNPKSLNFWLKIFDIELSKDVFENALFFLAVKKLNNKKNYF